MKTVAELKYELSRFPDDYYCHPDMMKGYIYLPQAESSIEKPVVNSIITDPYSARVLILQLEEEYNLSIRVYESKHYCHICIDKEKKDV